MDSNQIKVLSNHPIFYSSVIIVIYWLSWITELYLISPIQEQIKFLNLPSEIASIIFLPHGIRVMAVMLYGVKALPAIFIASITTGFLFLNNQDVIVLSIITTFSFFLTIMAFNFYKGFAFENIKLKAIIYVSVLASIVSSLFNSIYKYFTTQNIEFLNLILTHTLGDFFGAVVCFYIIGFIYFLKKNELK